MLHVLCLFFRFCNCCSRAASCFLHPSHTMLCVWSFFRLDKSAGAYAALPSSLLQGPAHVYSSGRRVLQPRFLHSIHTTFRVWLKWFWTSPGVKLCWGNMAAHAAHGINSHVRHTSTRLPLVRRKATRSWYTPHSPQRHARVRAPLYVLCVAPLSRAPAWRHAWQRTSAFRLKKFLTSIGLYCACTLSSPQPAHLINWQTLQQSAPRRNSVFGFHPAQLAQNSAPLQALQHWVLFRLRFFTADAS